MGIYIFICYPNDDDDVAAQRIEMDFDDDLDALDTAQNLAEQFHIDVWKGERLVARVKKGNAPLNVKDLHSG